MAGADPECGGAVTSWIRAFRQDVERYREAGAPHSALRLVLANQGLQALLQYRVANAIHRSALPPVLKRPLLVLMAVWQKLVEITAHASIPYRAAIGPGLLLGNLGNTFICGESVIGRGCEIQDGATLGVAGRGAQRGSPRLGDGVVVGERAVIAGKVVIGDRAVIAPGSLVISSFAADTVIARNPAFAVTQEEQQRLLVPNLPAPPKTVAGGGQKPAAARNGLSLSPV